MHVRPDAYYMRKEEWARLHIEGAIDNSCAATKTDQSYFNSHRLACTMPSMSDIYANSHPATSAWLSFVTFCSAIMLV